MKQICANSMDQFDHCVDLHGHTKIEAIYRVSQDVTRIENDLSNPNVGNGKDHIFQIICGAGHHSADKRYAIKNDIYAWLVNRIKPRKLPFWHDMKNGVFFVRITKETKRL